MKRSMFLAALLVCGRAWAGELNVDFAYHDDNDGTDDRATEKVPGQAFTFLANAKTTISDTNRVTLYILTANNFAGDADEQVFVRWWNGMAENWIMATWVTNLWLGKGDHATALFHDQPADWEVMTDLWKVEVGPDITEIGDNYYVIQLKGWTKEGVTEYYLLRDSNPENPRENNINQAWTDGGYNEHDWSVKITK